MKQVLWISITGIGLFTGGIFAVQTINLLSLFILFIVLSVYGALGFATVLIIHHTTAKYNHNMHVSILAPWGTTIILTIILATQTNLSNSVYNAIQPLLVFSSIGGVLANHIKSRAKLNGTVS